MPTKNPTTRLTLRQLAERNERVFSPFPQASRYFPAAGIEDARQRLGRSIERGDGPGLVIGAPGTGKSLLLQVLAAGFCERYNVVLLGCSRLCTRRALLQAILFELGLSYKLRDEGELRLSLLDHLLSNEDCPSGLLLLVDEAHTLPIALLDELRVLTNIVRGGMPRVRLVVAGSAALEEAFASAELESFSQRLSARSYLPPFGREETAQFIRAQLAASGVDPDAVVGSDAWGAVFEATDGVPRLVNQLCDRALWFAVEENRPCITRELIQKAWSDLQQLPTPWDVPASSAAASAAPQVIEFGGLKDDYRGLDDDLQDEVANIEPTDIDFDDEQVALAAPPAAKTHETTVSIADALHPFAEKFEEEEVVLDCFAAWDNVFRRDTPRVDNRRDPGFSKRVEAALAPSETAPVQIDEDDDELCEEECVDTESSFEISSARPQLRLADVPDAAHAELCPQIEPCFAERSSGVGFDTLSRPVEAESAILVIEDDAASSPNPPVRREEYRNLFSRLRSG